jgi:hypothetical protein
MLHHHNSVGTVRYWRAGHDPNRRAGFERTPLPLLPGSYLPRNPQRTITEIRGPDGKSIPRRPVERRLIPIGMNRLCQHAVFGGQQRYLLSRRRCQIGCMPQHYLERLIEADNTSRSLAHLVS